MFDRRFDLAVVGGGVIGAAIAGETARRGWSTALVERGDFGGATSANSLKILHGGLRYLQHLDLGRMRRSIRSRNFFLRRWPHLVDNVPFLLPLRGHGMKGPLVMRAGLAMNDLVALDRNRGVPRGARIGRGRVIPARRVAELAPGVDLSGCTGGALWFESVVNDTERLVLELVKEAAARGAAAANHLEAVALESSAGSVSGVACRDRLGEREGVVRAPLVIDATGTEAGSLGGSLGGYEPEPRRRVRAVNLILDRPLFDGVALGVACRDNVRDRASLSGDGERTLFFVPWRGRTMVGTFYDLEETTGAGLRLTGAEKSRFLAAVGEVLPRHGIAMEEVCRWHAGWLPVERGTPPGEIDLAKSSHVRVVRAGGRPTGLIEVTAAKFTTAPVVAEKVATELAALAAPGSRSRAAAPAFPRETDRGGVPSTDRLRRRYGSAWREVRAIAEGEPSTAAVVAGETTVAEVLYAIREEMALRLADVVMRRTDLASCGLPPESALRTVAEIMGRELGWEEEEMETQLASLSGEYEPG